MTVFGSQWAAPIVADCRYWNEGWSDAHVNTSLPGVIISHHDPVIQTSEGPQRPKWTMIDAVGVKTHIARRNSASQMSLEEHLGMLPRRRAADSIEIFAKEGAAVLHDHLRSNASTGHFLAVHRAVTALLHADDQYNSRWKQFVPFVKAPADGDHVVERLLKHLVDQTHDDDKERMEVFATHATIEAVARRFVDRGARAVDVRMVNQFWDRIDAETIA